MTGTVNVSKRFLDSCMADQSSLLDAMLDNERLRNALAAAAKDLYRAEVRRQMAHYGGSIDNGTAEFKTAVIAVQHAMVRALNGLPPAAATEEVPDHG
jgi:hypothetical protein